MAGALEHFGAAGVGAGTLVDGYHCDTLPELLLHLLAHDLLHAIMATITRRGAGVSGAAAARARAGGGRSQGRSVTIGAQCNPKTWVRGPSGSASIFLYYITVLVSTRILEIKTSQILQKGHQAPCWPGCGPVRRGSA